MHKTLTGSTIVGLAWVLSLTAAAQDPEDRGALVVDEWDAGPIAAAGRMIRTQVVFPGVAGSYPLVGVIHGAGRTGGRHIELARTLASRGFVVVLPDIPCTLGACDHDQNASQISALLDWAVTQSGTLGSRVYGRVDGERRGLVGHSWGALASHIAASRDARIDSLVLLDPNDDGTVGRDATAGVGAPTLQLLASVPGFCNNQWDEAMVTPVLPEPKLQLTVSGSGHCDPEEPGDAFCPIGCGAGDASLSAIFRRYAVAWTACNLTGDTTMGAWLGGASMSADQSAGRIGGLVSGGLDGLACRSGPPPSDGGPGEMDAGTLTDAGPPTPDAGSRDDGGTTSPDAARIDGSLPDAGSAGEGDGCGCRAAGGWPHRSPWAFVLGVLAFVARRRPRPQDGRITRRS